MGRFVSIGHTERAVHDCYKIPALTDSQKTDLRVMLNTLNDIQVKLEVYGGLNGINDLCGIAESVRDVMDRIAVHVEESSF